MIKVKYSKEEKQQNIDVKAFENALKKLIGERIDVLVNNSVISPMYYSYPGFIGTIIEYFLVKNFNHRCPTFPLRFILGNSEDIIKYQYPDFRINDFIAEVKANKNISRDGIKFTKEQQRNFTNSTVIIWVGYSYEDNGIYIDDIKVRTYGELTKNGKLNRVYKID